MPDFTTPPEPVAPDVRDGTAYLPGTNIPVLAGLDLLLIPISFVRPDPTNPRTLMNLDALVESIRAFGMRWPVVVNRRTGVIEAGHQRVEALRRIGARHVPVVWADDDKAMARAFMVADNKIGEIVAEWDEAALAAIIFDLNEEADNGVDVLGTLGFSDVELMKILDPDADAGDPDGASSLADRFLLPPFSVLMAREGWWQNRKRAWMDMGIRSELGRGVKGANAIPGVSGKT